MNYKFNFLLSKIKQNGFHPKMYSTNMDVVITEEQTIDVDKYHVKILTDHEQSMLKSYIDKLSKDDEESGFLFFDDLYCETPKIVLCLDGHF